MERSLKSEDGWLTVAGLFWLTKIDTPFGSEANMPILLPPGYPKAAGIFRMIERRVQVIPFDGIPVLVNGEPILNASLLNSDSNGAADVVTLGDLSFYVIERGPRTGIRMKDKNSEIRKNFTQRKWFPIDPSYRVEAKFSRYKQPLQRMVPTVLDGVVEEQEAIGTVEFMLKDERHSLEAIQASKGQLWFVFRDQTAGQQTYGAARFLYAPPPKNGITILDFNKAYNPPCAFNPYTTCPLPVKQNILPMAIEAGELKYDH
jgi:uncharacterized protein (DUF1684 family)